MSFFTMTYGHVPVDLNGSVEIVCHRRKNPATRDGVLAIIGQCPRSSYLGGWRTARTKPENNRAAKPDDRGTEYAFQAPESSHPPHPPGLRLCHFEVIRLRRRRRGGRAAAGAKPLSVITRNRLTTRMPKKGEKTHGNKHVGSYTLS